MEFVITKVGRKWVTINNKNTKFRFEKGSRNLFTNDDNPSPGRIYCNMDEFNESIAIEKLSGEVRSLIINHKAWDKFTINELCMIQQVFKRAEAR